MSGGFGWHQSSSSYSSSTDHSYDDAKSQYHDVPAVKITHIGATSAQFKPSVPVKKSPPQPTPGVWQKRNIETVTPSVIKTYPEAKHFLKSTAANVLIICVDVTISMKNWLDEIFRKLPTLYIEACQYFGSDDLEILFIAHGDVRTDNFPVQVTRFGRGQELDQMLASFYRKCGGGGQGDESQEIVAYYLLKQVDTSSAQNVYTYFITDEAACDTIDPKYVKEYLGLPMDSELTQTKDVLAGLQRRGRVFTVLCETDNDLYDPVAIRRRWETHVGQNNIIPLSDSRRVVDAILGSIAKLTGQLAQFTQNMTTRQQGSRYLAQNIETVQKSIALIGNNLPVVPQGKVKKPLV